MPINLYTSNRLEILADRLADVARKAPGDPMAPETVVVQSRGMERWLSMALAERLGVWANCRYPFPGRIVDEIFSAVMPGAPGGEGFGKDAMAWRIMSMLPSMLCEPGFSPLRDYLGSGKSQLRLWQLSERIADAFDRYLVYRPEMMLRWERGVEEGWQPRLWRELTRRTPGLHRASRLERFVETVGAGIPENAAASLPERLSVFGISFLPKFYIDTLYLISSLLEVNIFFLNPCREYWGDIKSERERTRLIERAGTGEDLYYEIGNNLLAGMGRSGRDFLWLLLDCDPQLNPLEEFDDPAESRGGSLLHAIQSDILAMRDGPSPEGSGPDGTVRIASCHGPMREVEALHDYLISLFDEDPALEPRDILVMTPDIETYGPYVQAVFRSAGDERRRIPFAVADRSALGESRAVETFLALFDLAGGRLTAAGVMKVLECADVRRRFALGDADVRLAGRWVRDAGIRWGLDAGHRVSLGLPGIPDHTWRAGMERLLLGYAMEPEGTGSFDGTVPCDVSVSDAAALGNFFDFTECLFSYCGKLSRPHDPAGWRGLLQDMAGDLFSPDDDTAADILSITETMRAIADAGDLAGHRGEVEPDVVATILRGELERDRPGKNFITGRVTVCATLPMRSIPFRVICLLGMNDGVFPRNPFVPGFDLLAERPRRGDRSVRDEDRYLFLETIISARDRLYVSYTGRSIGDNAPIPPSPVVSELMDYIERTAGSSGDLRDSVTTSHPLQAFSPAYFGARGPLFSYSSLNCSAAAALAGPRHDRGPFFAGPLPVLPAGAVSLNSLIGYFTAPARALLAERLGLRFEEEDAPFDETEPFGLDALERYRMGNELVKHISRGMEPAGLMAWYRASGRLPQGVPGELEFMELADGAGALARRLAHEAGGGAVPPLSLDVSLKDERIIGLLESVYPSGQVIVDYGKITARRRIRSWILHLALLSSGAGAVPPRTVLLCRDGACVMERFDAAKILNGLAALYRRGMTFPAAFYPETSFALADALYRGKKEADALAAARRVWEGSSRSGGGRVAGEGEDRYVRLCTGGEIEIGAEFISLAREIFFPMLERQSEEDL